MDDSQADGVFDAVVAARRTLHRDGDALILWHRTPAAKEILSGGFRDAPQRFTSEDCEDLGMRGVFVSSCPLDMSEGAKGRALLRVVLRATEAELDEFEIKDEEGTYREWCVPALMLNERADVALWDEFEDRSEG